MTIARAIELVLGATTGVFGVILSIVLIKEGYDEANSLAEPFEWVKTIGGLTILFAAPSLIIAAGSYAHAVSDEAGPGRFLIGAGSLFLIITFLLFTFGLGYAGIYMIQSRLLFVMMSILTLLASLLVRRKSLKP